MYLKYFLQNYSITKTNINYFLLIPIYSYCKNMRIEIDNYMGGIFCNFCNSFL